MMKTHINLENRLLVKDNPKSEKLKKITINGVELDENRICPPVISLLPFSR